MHQIAPIWVDYDAFKWTVSARFMAIKFSLIDCLNGSAARAVKFRGHGLPNTISRQDRIILLQAIIISVRRIDQAISALAGRYEPAEGFSVTALIAMAASGYAHYRPPGAAKCRIKMPPPQWF